MKDEILQPTDKKAGNGNGNSVINNHEYILPFRVNGKSMISKIDRTIPVPNQKGKVENSSLKGKSHWLYK